MGRGLELSGSKQGQATSSFKCGDEYSHSIKFDKFMTGSKITWCSRRPGHKVLVVLVWSNSPTRARAASFFRFLDDTQWHTTVGRCFDTDVPKRQFFEGGRIRDWIRLEELYPRTRRPDDIGLHPNSYSVITYPCVVSTRGTASAHSNFTPNRRNNLRVWPRFRE
jgi:hypothetical protein